MPSLPRSGGRDEASPAVTAAGGGHHQQPLTCLMSAVLAGVCFWVGCTIGIVYSLDDVSQVAVTSRLPSRPRLLRGTKVEESPVETAVAAEVAHVASPRETAAVVAEQATTARDVSRDVSHDVSRDVSHDVSRDVSHDVHAFYYAWYLNKAHDGRYAHWDHEHLAHWDARVNARYPPFRHDPDRGDVGASYYPKLGAYSSRDPDAIASHADQLASARVGVIVLSWYPPQLADPNGESVDDLVVVLLDAARSRNLTLCLHLEPYPDRSGESVSRDVRYALTEYATHPAYHRVDGRPVFYAYDSYQIAAAEWAAAFMNKVGTSAYLVALVLTRKHLEEYVVRGPFDAGYSYFGASRFTQAATPSSWRDLVDRASAEKKRFIPCVAPGYDDTRVRPWNGENRRDRDGGRYYDAAWRAAIDSGATIVAVTSFNEWHEGTQIEAAVPFRASRPGVEPYFDYGGVDKADFYIDKTRAWVTEFQGRTSSSVGASSETTSPR